MADTDLQAAVREQIEAAPIEREPFPHLVVANFLPADFFARLAETMPPVADFQPDDDIKSNLRIEDRNKYFARAPEEFRAVWARLRDEVIQGVVAPVLARRLEDDIRAKFAELFTPELAGEVMRGGLVSNPGRIMARKPGYNLRPHSDSAHFAVTCLLYFTSAGEANSGALCLYRPEREPELRHTGTYYAEREEGIGVELAKAIPISGNLFVAFLNTSESIHGVRIKEGEAATGDRLAYQVHVLPREDPRRSLDENLEKLEPGVPRTRWDGYLERRAEKLSRSSQKS
jgi:hypothetical protein